jgi:hypothetical protein
MKKKKEPKIEYKKIQYNPAWLDSLIERLEKKDLFNKVKQYSKVQYRYFKYSNYNYVSKC